MLKAFNIPNTLTTIRILLIPVFVTSVVYRRYDYALYVFVFAAATDGLDGLFARHCGQKTRLGTFLDPVADKFTLVTSFILFSYYGWIPKWLTITVISRDIIVVTGWVLLYFVTHASAVEPSLAGKLAIMLQFILLSYVLVWLNFDFVPSLHGVLVWGTGLVTAVSGLQYIYRGLRLTGERR
ncbi:MAG: CDP-alcohol phosphatidyltransferase family protein [Thermodesulfovibrionales bacterium]